MRNKPQIITMQFHLYKLDCKKDKKEKLLYECKVKINNYLVFE